MAVIPPSGFRTRLRRPDERLQQPARRRRHRGAGHRRGRARARARLVEEARAVRPADRRVPGPAMDARRHADAAHRGAAMLYRPRARAGRRRRFPDPMLAAQAKIFTSESAIKVVNDALQIFGARGYSRELPLERMARDVRMFTIGGGTAQVLRTLVASQDARLEAAADARRLHRRNRQCATRRSNHASGLCEGRHKQAMPISVRHRQDFRRGEQGTRRARAGLCQSRRL